MNVEKSKFDTWDVGNLDLRLTHFPESNETAGAFEKKTGEKLKEFFGENKVASDVLLIPSPDNIRFFSENPQDNEEQTFANQIDHLVIDSCNQTLWIVECKKRKVEFNRGQTSISLEYAGKTTLIFESSCSGDSDFSKKMKILNEMLVENCFPESDEIKGYNIKFWIVASELGVPKSATVCCLSMNSQFGATHNPFHVAQSEPRAGLDEKINYINAVRNYRTKKLCEQKKIGTTAKETVRRISGCAGSGKTILLCYHAWQFGNNNFGGAGNDNYSGLEYIFLVATGEHQVEVLKGLYLTIEELFHKNKSSNPSLPKVCYCTQEQLVRNFSEKNQKIKGKAALFLDEAQDWSSDKSALEGWAYLEYSIDRLQAIGKEKIKELPKASYYHALKVQYRMPVPIYLASLALAYRWLSKYGCKYVRPPTKTSASDLLKDNWGIYYTTLSRKLLIAQTSTESGSTEEKGPEKIDKVDSLFWSNKLKEIPKSLWINEERAAYTQHPEISQHRLSQSCHLHPGSNWINGCCIAVKTKEEVNKELELIENNVPNKRLWVRFQQAGECEYSDPDQYTVGNGGLLELEKNIKGKEWPFVVIEGLPNGFDSKCECSDGNQECQNRDRIRASQILHLVISRASCFVRFIQPEDEEIPIELKLIDLEGDKKLVLQKKEHSGWPGLRQSEVECEKIFEENFGLRWGKTHECEPGMWWHLSWNVDQKSKAKAIYATNTNTELAGEHTVRDGNSGAANHTKSIQTSSKPRKKCLNTLGIIKIKQRLTNDKANPKGAARKLILRLWEKDFPKEPKQSYFVFLGNFELVHNSRQEFAYKIPEFLDGGIKFLNELKKRSEGNISFEISEEYNSFLKEQREKRQIEDQEMREAEEHEEAVFWLERSGRRRKSK